MRDPEMQTVMGKTCVSESIILFDTFAVSVVQILLSVLIACWMVVGKRQPE
jgi:hypothetical protein